MVSIVVPVYNVEKYLGDCIDSILTQTFTDYEVIFVNDGSTDGSADILWNALVRFPEERVRVIVQENQGLSAARNAGMDVARGKYIYFLDSDDMIVPTMLETTVRRMEQDRLDLLFFAAKKIFESPDLVSGQNCESRDDLSVDSGIVIMRKMRATRKYRDRVGMLVARRELLSDCGIVFIPGVIHEDVPFTFEVLIRANRVAVLSEKLQIYRRRKDSIMTSLNLVASFKGHIASLHRMREIVSSDKRFQTKEASELCVRARRLANQAFSESGLSLNEYHATALSLGICSQETACVARSHYWRDVLRFRFLSSSLGKVALEARALVKHL